MNQPFPDSPYLTETLPGIGGAIREEPEDFRVEEIPAYLPSGTGEHLFLLIEKRDVAADQLMQHLSQTLDIRQRDIGMAGLKDRRAVTRQYVSVPAACGDRIAAVTNESIRVLSAQRHNNKLKTGHLRGNRFEITVRGVAEQADEKAVAIRQILLNAGVPNYFGEQRFGSGGRTAVQGLELLRGEQGGGTSKLQRDRFRLRLALSAAQSLLFNELLARRIQNDLLARVLPGDVMQVVTTGGCFVVEDLEAEQTRFDAGETVITGPIFGPKMKSPAGEVAAREQAVLEKYELSADTFRRFGKLTLGTRRPYLIRLPSLDIEPQDGALRFRFELPSGVYATSVLREFMKDELSRRS